eukprot:6247866-Amphidinium_carterae.2
MRARPVVQSQPRARWVSGRVQSLEPQAASHSWGETAYSASANSVSGPHDADCKTPNRANCAACQWGFAMASHGN